MDRTRTGRTVGRTVGRTLGGLALLALGAACVEAWPGGPGPRTEVVTPLPVAPDSFVKDPDALRAFVRSLTWEGGEQDRACEGDGCTGPNPKSTRVHFAAPNYAAGVNLDTLPANGVLVGRFRNTGDRREAKYGLDHGSWLKPIDYYVVLQPDPSSPKTPGRRRAHVALIRVAETKFDGKPPRVTIDRRASFFGDCAREHPASHTALIDFIGCPPPPSTTRSAAMASKRLVNAWIDCLHGCCYMGESEE